MASCGWSDLEILDDLKRCSPRLSEKCQDVLKYKNYRLEINNMSIDEAIKKFGKTTILNIYKNIDIDIMTVKEITLYLWLTIGLFEI